MSAEPSRNSGEEPARARDPAAEPEAGGDGGPDGPFTAAAEWLSETLRWARDVVALAAAEVELAAASGVTMLMLAIVGAACALLAWVFAAAVAAYGLVVLGLAWPVAGLALAAAHALAAYLLWRRAVRLSRSLTLPELRRSLLSEDY